MCHATTAHLLQVLLPTSSPLAPPHARGGRLTMLTLPSTPLDTTQSCRSGALPCMCVPVMLYLWCECVVCDVIQKWRVGDHVLVWLASPSTLD